MPKMEAKIILKLNARKVFFSALKFNDMKSDGNHCNLYLMTIINFNFRKHPEKKIKKIK